MQVMQTLDYDLLSPENQRDPYKLYARLREIGLHWHEGLGGWCLSSFADVSMAATNTELLASGFEPDLERAREAANSDEIELFEGLSRWFAFTDPPYHTKLRMLTHKVALEPMKRAKPTIEALADECLDRALPTGKLEVINELARPVALGTVISIMGVPREDFPDFTRWSGMMSTLVAGALSIPDRTTRALEGKRAMDAYFGAVIDARRSNPSDDFMSAMLAVEHPVHGKFTDDEIKATCAMMLFGGHGTTTDLVANMLLALLTHPEQLALVRADPKLVMPTVDETLRWDSSVQIMVRVAACDDAAGLIGVRKGDKVFLFAGAANHDPVNGKNYDRFDITRNDGKHLSFGLGIHACLGAALARMEAAAVLSRMLAKLTRIELAISVDQLRWEKVFRFRSLSSLPLNIG